MLLKKQDSINLSKSTPNLKKIRVGLGWDAQNLTDSSANYDLDVSVFICTLNDQREPKLISDSHFVFYNNKCSPNAAVVHTGDNRTGDGDGDDESILIDLNKIDTNAQELSFIVTIYEANERKQSFGEVQNAYIRVYDDERNSTLAEYHLTEVFKNETAVQFGSLLKNQLNQWSFKAVGAGYRLTLGDFLEGYR